MAALEIEVAVIKSVSGVLETTALKFPLVPSTHPRV
jgi:hypothetical protein